MLVYLKCFGQGYYCIAMYINLNLRAFDMISEHTLNYFFMRVSKNMKCTPISTSPKLGFSTNKC